MCVREGRDILCEYAVVRCERRRGGYSGDGDDDEGEEEGDGGGSMLRLVRMAGGRLYMDASLATSHPPRQHSGRVFPRSSHSILFLNFLCPQPLVSTFVVLSFDLKDYGSKRLVCLDIMHFTDSLVRFIFFAGSSSFFDYGPRMPRQRVSLCLFTRASS